MAQKTLFQFRQRSSPQWSRSPAWKERPARRCIRSYRESGRSGVSNRVRHDELAGKASDAQRADRATAGSLSVEIRASSKSDGRYGKGLHRPDGRVRPVEGSRIQQQTAGSAVNTEVECGGIRPITKHGRDTRNGE